MTVYLDCAATTPMDPVVREVLLHHLSDDFGNAGSRTHEYGLRAKRAVERAREQVAELAGARPDEVVFTSGATESNNLAIQGIADFGRAKNRLHVLVSAIEHKAVLEPALRLRQQGFDLELIPCRTDGVVDVERLGAMLRDDTLLVSVMHVNNETGVEQPIAEIAKLLAGHPAYFHVDAAQGFGKQLGLAQITRVDLLSISGHKLYGPCGIGALILRRRQRSLPPISALFAGGGQERGIRPGTVPVALAAALGAACHQCRTEHEARRTHISRMRADLERWALGQDALIVGPQGPQTTTILGLIFPDLDSESVMLAWKDLVAVSNGAACSSREYATSHVLEAMGVPVSLRSRFVRLSWCHMTPPLPLEDMSAALSSIR
ncbi:MAG: aminotransferase class V-fold PLP-dependent enzyme [Fimbriimonadaceae bacterium]|nr:aminotransferase class V-fold PLP-dependent enzyme [Fimbriimonadaceae bacterium]